MPGVGDIAGREDARRCCAAARRRGSPLSSFEPGALGRARRAASLRRRRRRSRTRPCVRSRCAPRARPGRRPRSAPRHLLDHEARRRGRHVGRGRSRPAPARAPVRAGPWRRSTIVTSQLLLARRGRHLGADPARADDDAACRRARSARAADRSRRRCAGSRCPSRSASAHLQPSRLGAGRQQQLVKGDSLTA